MQLEPGSIFMGSSISIFCASLHSGVWTMVKLLDANNTSKIKRAATFRGDTLIISPSDKFVLYSRDKSGNAHEVLEARLEQVTDFKIKTRNSIYSISLVDGGFEIEKTEESNENPKIPLGYTICGNAIVFRDNLSLCDAQGQEIFYTSSIEDILVA